MSSNHFGHKEGEWFWGCDVCNPVTGLSDSTKEIKRESKVFALLDASEDFLDEFKDKEVTTEQVVAWLEKRAEEVDKNR